MESILSFIEKNSIYIVFIILFIVWIGIFLFVNSTDKRLKKIESILEEKQDEE